VIGKAVATRRPRGGSRSSGLAAAAPLLKACKLARVMNWNLLAHGAELTFEPPQTTGAPPPPRFGPGADRFQNRQITAQPVLRNRTRCEPALNLLSLSFILLMKGERTCPPLSPASPLAKLT